jgi:hypothetical protein
MNLECPICCQIYNLSNLEPMSLKCGHTFCKECCGSFDRCPYDRQYIYREQLTKNFGLISLIEDFRQRAAKFGLDLLPDGIQCKMHDIERTLFCITDNIAVCAECVLFGDHAGHNIKKIEDLKLQGDKLVSGMTSTADSINIESLLDTQEELKRKSAKIQESKKKTIQCIEREFTDFIETLNEEKTRLIAQVDDLFKIAENNLNQCLNAKKDLARANSELLLKNKTTLTSLSANDSDKDITKLVQKITLSEKNNDQLKKLAADLATIESRYRVDEIAQAISTNVDQTFYRKPLTDETPTSFILRKVNFLEDFSSSFDKYNDLKIFVRNVPLSLNELSISELLKSCGNFSSLKMGNSSGVFNGCFKVEFETPEAAKRFLFLNSMTIDRKLLQINYDTSFDPETGGNGLTVLNAEKQQSSGKTDVWKKEKKAPKYSYNQFTRGIYGDEED